MRRPIILMHVDDRRRDGPALVLLAKLLRHMGNRVFLCNRLTNRLYWTQLQPDAMVTPYPWMGVRGPEELAHRAQRTRMIVLPTEGLTTHYIDFAPQFFGDCDEYARHVTKALMWGPAAKRSLLKTGLLEESQVPVVGCPRFDFYYPEVPLKQLLPLDTRPGVGFVGAFTSINIYDQRSVFENVDGLRGDDRFFGSDGNLEEFYGWELAVARLYLELMDEWILSRQGVARYRPHPFEYFDSYKYLQAKYGEKFTLDEPLNPVCLWLASVEAIVTGNFSTSAIEAMITGKPVITLRRLVPSRFDSTLNLERLKTPILDYFYQPHTIAEAADMFEAALKGELQAADASAPGLASILRDQLDWPRGEFSISSAAREIDSVAKEAADANRSHAVSMNLLKAEALPYALRAGLNLRSLMRHHSPIRRRVDELSTFWPWHHHEWRIAGRLFGAMLPKMMEDLEQVVSRQPVAR